MVCGAVGAGAVGDVVVVVGAEFVGVVAVSPLELFELLPDEVVLVLESGAGVAVGVAVGVGDGVAVGAGVGVAVGVGDGDGLGAAVGGT